MRLTTYQFFMSRGGMSPKVKATNATDAFEKLLTWWGALNLEKRVAKGHIAGAYVTIASSGKCHQKVVDNSKLVVQIAKHHDDYMEAYTQLEMKSYFLTGDRTAYWRPSNSFDLTKWWTKLTLDLAFYTLVGVVLILLGSLFE